MNIIHGVNRNPPPLPRRLTTVIVEALTAFPVVVVTGARQTGKSTLIHELLKTPQREYHTLDDIDILERAEAEPDALVSAKAPTNAWMPPPKVHCTTKFPGLPTSAQGTTSAPSRVWPLPPP